MTTDLKSRVTASIVRLCVSKELGVGEEDVELRDLDVEPSNVGEGFLCTMFRVTVTSSVGGKERTHKFIAKCKNSSNVDVFVD